MTRAKESSCFSFKDKVEFDGWKLKEVYKCYPRLKGLWLLPGWLGHRGGG